MSALSTIPSIDRLLRDPKAEALLSQFGRERLVEALRQATAGLRTAPQIPPDPTQTIVAAAEQHLLEASKPRLRKVLNATGVVIHTNLGRSPLSTGALARIQEVAGGYCNLEMDLSTGQRGSRYDSVKSLFCQATGAPDAFFVNNCAAAMVLVLDELASGREVVVSRGELVEIGGSFRVPEVLRRSGARLVEVGTTNRTYVRDYAEAIGESTGLLLSTHLSNFVQLGFVHKPTWAELVALGRQRHVLSCLDLGSGQISGALNQEPGISQAIEAGFDLIAFSGDKLMGGPQIGIVVAASELIERLARNPLARALRPDKLALAALEGTLLDLPAVPVTRMLTMDPTELRRRADRLAESLGTILGTRAQIEVIAGQSSVGGGSAPEQPLPTWLVCLQPLDQSEEWWARKLRQADPPVIVRRVDGCVCLDPRTLFESDTPALLAAFS